VYQQGFEVRCQKGYHLGVNKAFHMINAHAAINVRGLNVRSLQVGLGVR
jgi:hypothetical protein